MSEGALTMGGALGVRRIGARKAPLTWRVRNTLRWGYIWGWLAHVVGHAYTRLFGNPVLLGELHVRVRRAGGEVIDYGCVGRRVVTTAYVQLLTDELQASVAAHSTLRYHGVGTGNTAEAVGDTTLVTEVESRVSGTQAENAANIYESVGTVTATGARAIVEHGVFSASSAGTLLDRTVFSVVNLATNDSIQCTYRLTLTAGG
jgi:hypothetical protein